MPRKNIVQDSADGIDMSSMIDVVFLLLIFFIVTAKDPIEEAHISINYPKKEENLDPSGSNDDISISILPEKEAPKLVNGILRYNPNARVYLYEQTPANLSELAGMIKSIAGISFDKGKVNIKASKKAVNLRIVNLLDLCGKLGLQDKLNLSELPEK